MHSAKLRGPRSFLCEYTADFIIGCEEVGHWTSHVNVKCQMSNLINVSGSDVSGSDVSGSNV